MKKIYKAGLLVIILTLTITACKKDDSSSNITNVVQQGSWKVILYNDSGTDETYHFSGYSFNFNSGGSVSATKTSSTVVNGSWSTGNDDSQEKLYLDFGANQPFDEINDDWHIIEQTSNKIRLEDVSGGNGGTDLLTFESI